MKRKLCIRVWGNGLGAEVRCGDLHLEVWKHHGGVTRCVDDESLVGHCGTHYARVAVGPIEEMCASAVELWKKNPAAWTPCEEN